MAPWPTLPRPPTRAPRSAHACWLMIIRRWLANIRLSVQCAMDTNSSRRRNASILMYRDGQRLALALFQPLILEFAAYLDRCLAVAPGHEGQGHHCTHANATLSTKFLSHVLGRIAISHGKSQSLFPAFHPFEKPNTQSSFLMPTLNHP